VVIAEITNGLPQIALALRTEDLRRSVRGFFGFLQPEYQLGAPCSVCGTPDLESERDFLTAVSYWRKIVDYGFGRIWRPVPDRVNRHRKLRWFAQI
jgi:hypothetical protein